MVSTLSAASGTNADGSCIAVNAPRTKLYLGGSSIIGLSEGTGTGVHLLKNAVSCFIDGSDPAQLGDASADATISAWNIGIEDEASNTLITNVNASANSTAGILIQNAKAVTLSLYTTNANGDYGVWLSATVTSEVSNGSVGTLNIADVITGNGKAGIFVGCQISNTTGKCIPPKAPSNGNRIFANDVIGNTAATGILMQTNAHNNIVTSNTSTTNKLDLQDLNNSCDSNTWTRNQFGTANPSNCIE